MSNVDREKALQDLWASAYDCWIDVPGADEVIYTRPAGGKSSSSSSVATATDAPPTPPAFPSIVTSSRLFALTAGLYLTPSTHTAFIFLFY